ncbi:hypothetical protein [Aestuariivivens sediminicola]|uniref:hypothetical protein n=1 Tax=Aestuariivivens sediminicola TaxID=2913560 RepID=UPI001F56A047|nr:hypothetical protein [Aestuariivivens sediminicola]
MSKYKILTFVLFISITLSSQNYLETLMSFKSMTLNEIEQTLILIDFDFVRKEIVDENNASIVEKLSKNWYETRFYEFTNSQGENIKLKVTKSVKNTYPRIVFVTDSKNIRRTILTDMINMNFEISDEKSNNINSKFTNWENWEGYYGGNSYNELRVGKNGVIERSPILYTQNSTVIVASTLKVSEIQSVDKVNFSFKYYLDKISSEYEFIVVNR